MTPGKWVAIIGIVVGALFLFCCVPAGLIGGYFLFWGGNAANLAVAAQANRVTRENFNKITEGMTPAQVEEILGRGTPVLGGQDLFEWRAPRVTIRVGFVNGRVNRRQIVEMN
jgi:hypothetical protein